jgi:membrane protein YdbS with pleckstrin-like domain
MNITEFLQDNHLLGVTIGAATFVIIGLFHPLVIKGHYYFGTRCRWWFLVAGIVCLILAVVVQNVLWSSLLGVVAFSSMWSIKEILEQEQRVKKGWFPENPKRAKK